MTFPLPLPLWSNILCWIRVLSAVWKFFSTAMLFQIKTPRRWKAVSVCAYSVFILRGFKFLPVIFTLRIIKRTISFPPSLSRAPDTLTLTITASRNPISGKQAVIFFPRSRLRFLGLINFCNLLVWSAKTGYRLSQRNNYFAWKPVENFKVSIALCIAIFFDFYVYRS